MLSHRGIKPVWNDNNLCFLSGLHNEPITLVGSAAGIWNHEKCLESGVAGGIKVSVLLGKTKIDYSFGMRRIEYHCANCGAHHGHIFDDGPGSTGKRFCNNGLCLIFKPKS